MAKWLGWREEGGGVGGCGVERGGWQICGCSPTHTDAAQATVGKLRGESETAAGLTGQNHEKQKRGEQKGTGGGGSETMNEPYCPPEVLQERKADEFAFNVYLNVRTS